MPVKGWWTDANPKKIVPKTPRFRLCGCSRCVEWGREGGPGPLVLGAPLQDGPSVSGIHPGGGRSDDVSGSSTFGASKVALDSAGSSIGEGAEEGEHDDAEEVLSGQCSAR